MAARDLKNIRKVSRNTHRDALLGGVSSLVLLLSGVGGTQAGDILRGNKMAAPAAQVTADQAAAMVRAQETAKRTANTLSQVTRSLAAMRAAQESARKLALDAASNVPDGLGEGGLDVADGVIGTDEWLNADAPVQNEADGRVQVGIKQTNKKAVLTWESFNVGKETDLHFDQRAGGANANDWIALNKVEDPSASPSRILGSIKAEGQVYIVNRNGIIFGGSSQVNTSGLIASALSYKTEQFIDNPVLSGSLRRLPTATGEGGITEPIVIAGGGNGNYAFLPEFGEAPEENIYYDGGPEFVPDHVPGDVIVEAGAEINATDKGRLMLFGRQVRNSGSLSAVDGQVILAAGEQVFIRGERLGDEERRFSNLSSYGHLEVLATAAPKRLPTDTREIVRRDMFDDINRRAEELDFRVVNDGVISSQRGDVTLQARVVEQDGVLHATTALNNRAGSIHLQAVGGGWFQYHDSYWGWRVSEPGDVFVRDGALNLVMPDPDDTTLEISQLETRYQPSQIELSGENIVLENSLTWAPGGHVSLFAVSEWRLPDISDNDYFTGIPTDPDDWSGRVYLDEGAVISVAGLVDISVPMSRNNVEVELRVNELADLPLQRDGFLYGNKFWVDRRATGLFEDGLMAGIEWFDEKGRWYGTPIGNVSGWLNNAEISVQELVAQGGAVNFLSTGDIVTRAGSVIDVAGGSIKYEAGELRTSRLLGADGRIYDISQATPDMQYVGIAGEFTRVHSRWGVNETWNSPLIRNTRYDPGYTEGQTGGAVKMLTFKSFVLEGNVVGGAIVGERQRGQNIFAGRLQVGGVGNPERRWSLDNLRISANPYRLPEEFSYVDALPTDIFNGWWGGVTHLSDDFFSESDLSEIALYTYYGESAPILGLPDNVRIEADAQISMKPGAILNFGYDDDLPRSVAGDIRIPGGSVIFGGEVRIEATSSIDLSGMWINDVVGGVDYDLPQFAIDGGNFEMWDPASVVETGARIDASGGGWYRQMGEGVEAGDAGSITLRMAEPADLSGLDFRGYALGKGGTLNIYAPMLDVVLGLAEVGGGPALHLPTGLYMEKGFSSVNVYGDDIFVSDVDVRPTAQIYMLDDDYANVATGASLSEIATVTAPDARVFQTNGRLSLGLRGRGDITVTKDTVIDMGRGGAIVLSNTQSETAGAISIAGRLKAAGGIINIGGALDTETIDILDGAVIDVSGEALLYTSAVGQRRLAWTPDGGSIGISGSKLNIEAGSLLDARGGTGIEVDMPFAGGLTSGQGWKPTTIAGNGGAIVLSGGGMIAGRLLAGAGGRDAIGGTLAIAAGGAGGGGGPLPVNFKSDLGNFEPSCFGYGSGVCEFNGDWEESIGFDWGELIQGFGGEYREVIFSRAFIDFMAGDAVDSSVTISETAAGGGSSGFDPAAFGLSWDDLEYWANFMYGSNIFEELVPALPPSNPLIIRPSVVNDGGFGFLDITATNQDIKLENVALSIAGAVTINGNLANAGGNSLLSAPYVQIRGGARSDVTASSAGTLTIETDVLEANALRTLGYARTELIVSENLVLSSLVQGDQLLSDAPFIRVDGDLHIDAGIISASTGARAEIVSPAVIETVRSSGYDGTILSAGSEILLQAPDIIHGGVITAPLGTIRFEGSNRTVLRPGSIASVSADGLNILYGRLANGESWRYGINSAKAVLQPPEKRVVIEGPDVRVEEGALIDIRGGGDLYAWEFVAGTGGSHDVLELDGTYAILPGYVGSLAPVDPDAVRTSASGQARTGDQIYISSVHGLADGYYTLLPSRYAMLPGGYLVQESSLGTQIARGGRKTVRLPDGSYVASAHIRNAFDGSVTPYASDWYVLPGETFRQYSEYNETTANAFFSSDQFKAVQYRNTGLEVVTPRLPMDGGSLVLDVDGVLALDGRLDAASAEGGSGGQLDITADKIAVVGAGADIDSLIADDYLVVGADELSAFGAGSMLLGGTRQQTLEGVVLDVGASSFRVENDAGSILHAPEIILAASGEVHIADGSVIESRGRAGETDGDILVAPQADGTPAEDYGAIVRVANSGPVIIRREGIIASTGGHLAIGDNVTIRSDGAVFLDGTGSTALGDGSIIEGRYVTLSSGRIGIGGGDADSLVLSEELLSTLSGAEALSIASYSSIDFFSSGVFKISDIDRLMLDAGSYRQRGDGDIEVRAGEIVLINHDRIVDPATGGTSGSLTFAADRILFGEGEKNVDGFSSLVLEAAHTLFGEERGSIDAGDADVSVRTGGFAGAAGSFQEIRTTGQLAIAGSTGGSSALSESVGSRFAFEGRSVAFEGNMRLAGGSLALTSTNGDVIIADNSIIDLSGGSKAIFDRAVTIDGGSLGVTAAGGDILVGTGALIDVSGNVTGGNAGSVSFRSDGGGFVLGGTLQGKAGVDGKGGAFALDLAQILNFGTLNGMLDGGGFSYAREFRVRDGDVLIGGAMRAETIVVQADSGSITLDGVMDARSRFGGSVEVIAGEGLIVEDGAQILAGAEEDYGSGRVSLRSATVVDAGGGLIDVSGGDGRLIIRAPKTSSGDDVEVASFGTNVVGARRIMIEGVEAYGASNVSDVLPDAVTDATAFAANEAAVQARLGRSDFSLSTNIVIQSVSDLLLDSEVDLNALTPAVRSGTLTLRAGGNLNIEANISDGFSDATTDGQLLDTESWNLQFVTGADMSAVNPLATEFVSVLGGSGNLTVGKAGASGPTSATGNIVRTGTGDLTIAAGGRFVMPHWTSAVYTAGRRDADLPGHVMPGDDVIDPDAGYGIHGGNVNLTVGADIDIEPGTSLFDWMRRQGNVDPTSLLFVEYEDKYGTSYVPSATAWWVDYGRFQQGAGALGGGSVRVDAGGDISNLIAAVPTNGRLTGGRTAGVNDREITIRNGGLLDVDAAGNILAGQYYVARGHTEITAAALAEGRVIEYKHRLNSSSSSFTSVAPVIGIGDASVRIVMQEDLTIEAIIDPFLLTPLPSDHRSLFSLYGENTAFDFLSLGGDLTLKGQKSILAGNTENAGGRGDTVFGDTNHAPTTRSGGTANLLAARTRLAAPSGSVEIGGLTNVMPGRETDVAILAGQDVIFANTGLMFSRATGLNASPLYPLGPHPLQWITVPEWIAGRIFDGLREWVRYEGTEPDSAYYNLQIEDLPYNQDDHTPGVVYALDGDIRSWGRSLLSYRGVEQTHFRAGGDITGLTFDLTNLRPSDVSMVVAGGVVNMINSRPPSTIRGPGSLVVQAAGDIYANDIRSISNRRYAEAGATDVLPFIPEGSTSLYLIAGIQAEPDFAAFETAYLDPNGALADYVIDPETGTSIYIHGRTQDRDGREKVEIRSLADFVGEMTGENYSEASAEEIWEAFSALPEPTRRTFLYYVYTEELRQAGRDQNKPGEGDLPLNGGYNRGYAAIEALFPGDGWNGDIRFPISSDFYQSVHGTLITQEGGDIFMIAPGGGVELAPLDVTVAPGRGALTLGYGDIRIATSDDVIVNRSRILTFEGGDVAIWSTFGGIDAGRGKKTLRSPNAPEMRIDNDGNRSIRERADVSGSGIGSIAGFEGVEAGDVDLIAPVGTVNAGDAGIRVSGNLNVAARFVVGTDNIDVEGEVTGIPQESSSINVIVEGDTAGQTASEAVERVTQQQGPRAMPSIVTVEVVGFGGYDANGNESDWDRR
ncbi:filamentous hemagglutinin family protein [Tepidicaulis sp. LMO-SS28]|uniref:filamentous haemagglutinin family protein n=1 Tax=Tepidicaulis sp. LMO-SS28 TaxID=3447455 RepID=UPI003EDF00B6